MSNTNASLEKHINRRINRSLKNKDMDQIDHALGRPLDPRAETFRDYFFTDLDSDEAATMHASKNWKQGNSRDNGVYFFVTEEGRETLRNHLKQLGDPHRLFAITLDGLECSPVIDTTHGKARYSAFLNISDTFEINFKEFCCRSTVRLAKGSEAANA